MSNELPPLDEQTFKPPLTETEEIVAREKMPFVGWILDCRERQLSAALEENAELKRTQGMILKCSSQWQHDYVNAMIELTDQKEANRALELQRDLLLATLAAIRKRARYGLNALGVRAYDSKCEIPIIKLADDALSLTDTYWREMAEKEKDNG